MAGLLGGSVCSIGEYFTEFLLVFQKKAKFPPMKDGCGGIERLANLPLYEQSE